MTICETDLRPGGEWRFGWRKDDDGTEMAMKGVHREVQPPERLVSTESWGGDWPETLNEITFSEADSKTTIELRIHYPSKQARDAAMATGMKDGANATFHRFDEYLRTAVPNS